jgi:transcriptional regulator with XRE-family HTH domain
MSELPNNLRHLLGLHDLTASKASALLGLSQQALSELQAGRRENPRRQTVQKLATFFEVTGWKLEGMPFDQLLADELSDQERYLKVEAKIPRTATGAGADDQAALQ